MVRKCWNTLLKKQEETRKKGFRLLVPQASINVKLILFHSILLASPQTLRTEDFIVLRLDAKKVLNVEKRPLINSMTGIKAWKHAEKRLSGLKVTDRLDFSPADALL